jgi:predicted DNA-binding antitoxin AbrB/MazE fold protein
MLALKGYFNGKEFVPLEKVNLKPNQKVIITVLDEYLNVEDKPEKSYKKYVGKLSSESFHEINEALCETEKVDVNEW